ncbi:rod shape-determining protein [Candidatus Gracilibacteria bacterium]|nr:rod shape-determining protein [Candidatus Gracilibacteria bacterium]MCF7856260.1 rod shape-determining protein [Candidatus Gracilibacteria bacterium]MCF7896261.1 rod shape-determining protein [Candidatus Gracilibacteria bacterium]
MFSKFFSKFRPKAPDGSAVLALDIGTEFVKALIYRIEENHGFVIGYAKVRQKMGDMAAGSVSNIAGVTETAAAAIEQAARIAGTQPEQAVMGIAGELVCGATTTISYTREDPQLRIELPELRAIVQRVQTRAFDKVRRELSRDTGHNEIDVKLVNAAIIDSKIDGQRASNPIGFQGSQVTLSVFNSFAPLVHFGALQTIAAELELDLLTIAAEPFAVARCLTGEDLSAIFIDVGGGTTDLALLRNGGELTTKMFAVGGRTFTKRISHSLNVSHDEAERIKIDYSQNKLSDRRQKIIQNALAGDIEVWVAGVEVALAEMMGGQELPSQILLCGGGSKLPEIKKILSAPEFTESLPFGVRPKIKFLCPDDVTNFTDQTRLIRTVQDVTPLALANLGLGLAGEEGLLSMILRKTVKLIQN